MKIYFTLFFTIIISVSSYSINPMRDYIGTPSDYGICYTEKFIDVDNYTLCMWESTPEKQLHEKTIVLAYGDYGNMSYYMRYIQFYVNLGYRVISFDYRGFGKSSDLEIEIKDKMLYYEEFIYDLDNILSYSVNNLQAKDITIISLSMGTVITALSNKKEYICSIIAEGAVYNSEDLIFRLVEKEVELPINPKNTVEGWNSIESNILVFAGEQDNITTINDAALIINQDVENRTLIPYEAGHLAILNTVEGERLYYDTVKKFLKNECS